MIKGAIKEINRPVLMTGGRRNEYYPHYKSVYKEQASQLQTSAIILYDKGRHPAAVSNSVKFAKDVAAFSKKIG